MRPKPYSCLTDDNDKNEKIKGIKKCVIKQKLKFGDYKNCLEATQIENKISQLIKKVDADSLTESHKKFIKHNKLILKSQKDLETRNITCSLKKFKRLH